MCVRLEISRLETYLQELPTELSTESVEKIAGENFVGICSSLNGLFGTAEFTTELCSLT